MNKDLPELIKLHQQWWTKIYLNWSNYTNNHEQEITWTDSSDFRPKPSSLRFRKINLNSEQEDQKCFIPLFNFWRKNNNVFYLLCSFQTAVLSGSMIPKGLPQDFIARPILDLFVVAGFSTSKVFSENNCRAVFVIFMHYRYFHILSSACWN